MDRKVTGALQILFSIAIVATVLLMNDSIASFKEYGYPGVFVISLLSSATLFFPAPGWAVVLAMSNVLNPYLLGIIAGISSGIGETTGYIAGRGTVQIINKKNDQYKKFERFIKKYDMPAIFVLAFIPNPLFDVAGIVAGALKIPYWKYILPAILGRTVRYVLLAYLGAYTLGLLS